MSTFHTLTPCAAGYATLVLRGPDGPVYSKVRWPRPPVLDPVDAPEQPYPVTVVVSPRSGATPPADTLACSFAAAGSLVLSLTVPIDPAGQPAGHPGGGRSGDAGGDRRGDPGGDAAAAVGAVRTAIEWIADHARELDGDPRRLTLVGQAGVTGLVADVAATAEENGGPAIGQLLLLRTGPDPPPSATVTRLVPPSERRP
ncbi:hypothetical protein E1212_20095 [Jiangella ureilytica]|uniref:Alpha/beta hydrolase n=1 Tax=Jiangella ureilytica TaxID=2530374 RepID=A0A4R4RH61_9ACTN|nr:hypothetical protein [Jiangella ureilytica]TDC48791.1 hypothetical protein E1212_20095 [Jiangella ureilytica]